jgi:hypothetical protein
MSVQQLDKIDPLEFNDIIAELNRQPLEVNKYRINVGLGRSQCFGIVSRRSLAPDLSRHSWRRAKLHHLLMEYARKYLKIPFTSIQVNQNMECAEHLDKGNIGMSYIVGFGDYPEGGNLKISDYSYNIRYQPLLFDGSKEWHKTEIWRGNRFTIVFHTVHPKKSYIPLVPSLSVYQAFQDEKDLKWKIKDTRSGSVYWGSNGLPHPLKGRVKDLPLKLNA